MSAGYGYGKLEDKLIDLLRSGAPDFKTAQELIMQGSNLNKKETDDDENILSEILRGYGRSQHEIILHILVKNVILMNAQTVNIL